MASYLTREHFATRIVDNGPVAVTVACDFDPDVVILDMGLPGGGVDVRGGDAARSGSAMVKVCPAPRP